MTGPGTLPHGAPPGPLVLQEDEARAAAPALPARRLPEAPRLPEAQPPRRAAPVTWTLRAAGVLGAGGVLAEQRRAHLRLTQHPAAVARALGARVNVPRLPLHKVLAPGGVADGGRAELRLLHLEVIWGRREDPNTGNDPAAVSPAGEEPGAVGFEGQRRRAGGSYPEDREEDVPCTEIRQKSYFSGNGSSLSTWNDRIC